ncbi:c6 transcription factor [Ophiostoma piceae UAMH 11346]|uniref:C6 transcription factor n=1 Tax=Ophiostoma piceae (strain UAMH 11346) TaxID=1262450 RepID=S3CS75_OPHP1|nr:c6 transcription factor [Ophiostoma piceae UAMH 11346]
MHPNSVLYLLAVASSVSAAPIEVDCTTGTSTTECVKFPDTHIFQPNTATTAGVSERDIASDIGNALQDATQTIGDKIQSAIARLEGKVTNKTRRAIKLNGSTGAKVGSVVGQIAGSIVKGALDKNNNNDNNGNSNGNSNQKRESEPHIIGTDIHVGNTVGPIPDTEISEHSKREPLKLDGKLGAKVGSVVGQVAGSIIKGALDNNNKNGGNSNANQKREPGPLITGDELGPGRIVGTAPDTEISEHLKREPLKLDGKLGAKVGSVVGQVAGSIVKGALGNNNNGDSSSSNTNQKREPEFPSIPSNLNGGAIIGQAIDNEISKHFKREPLKLDGKLGAKVGSVVGQIAGSIVKSTLDNNNNGGSSNTNQKRDPEPLKLDGKLGAKVGSVVGQVAGSIVKGALGNNNNGGSSNTNQKREPEPLKLDELYAAAVETSVLFLEAAGSSRLSLSSSSNLGSAAHTGRVMLRYYTSCFAFLLTTNLENNFFLLVLLPMAFECPPLLKELVAWSSTHLALRDSRFEPVALRHRGAALKDLNAAMSGDHGEAMPHEMALAVTMVLCSMECIGDGRSAAWYHHLRGGAAVLGMDPLCLRQHRLP